VVPPSIGWVHNDGDLPSAPVPNPLIDEFLRTWFVTASVDDLDRAIGLLDAVPIDELAQRPEVLAARYLLTLIPHGTNDDGTAATDFARELAQRLPSQSMFGHGLDTRGYVTTASALVLALQRDGYFARASDLAGRALERVDNFSVAEFAQGRSVLPWLFLVSGQALLSFERMHDSISLLERARDADDAFPRFAATALLPAAYALEGQLTRAIALFREVWMLGDPHGWVRGHYASAALVGFAIAQGARRDLNQQAVTIAQLWAGAQHTPQWLLAADLIEIDTLLIRGMHAAALALLNGRLRTVDLAAVEPIIRNLVWVARAKVLLADGRPGAVVGELRAAPETANHIGCHGSLRAFAYVSLNLPTAAIDATEECVGLAHEHSLVTLQNVFFARAAAFLQLDRKDAAMRDFSRGLLAASVGGYGMIEQLPLPIVKRLIAQARLRELRLPPQIEEVVKRQANGVDDCFERFGALSPRERAILPHLRSSDSFETLAARLFISENTLKAHNHHICAKLRVATREEAVAAVERFGYFDLPGIE
jgi:DNA-binding CsgD family transcriptional regulator/tetratricopeptide (TPR) repeat protein